LGSVSKYISRRFIREVKESLLKLQRLGDVYLERQYSNDRHPMTFDEWDGDIQRWRINAQQLGVEDVFVQISQGGLNDQRLYEAQAKEITAESE